MSQHVSPPKDAVEEIMVANGDPVKVETGGRYTYTSRYAQRVDANEFSAVVYECGGIDTDQKLVLVNVADRRVFAVCHHRVKTPAMYRGTITIQELVSQGGEVTLRYKVGERGKEEEFIRKFRYESHVEMVEKTVATLTPIEG